MGVKLAWTGLTIALGSVAFFGLAPVNPWAIAGVVVMAIGVVVMWLEKNN